MEIDKCKILSDLTVQTNNEIYGRRSDVIMAEQNENLCQIVDFACPCLKVEESNEKNCVNHLLFT